MPSTMIRVECLPRDREGYSFRCRAGRFWPSGQPVIVELLDQEPDFRNERPDGTVCFDPETTVEVEVRDHQTGDIKKVLRPNPKRVGRRAYRQLMGDKMLRISSAGEGEDPLAIKQEWDASELEKARARVVELEALLWNGKPPGSGQGA